ncbi:MAG: zinc-binding dehydrogenase [Bilophila wadsworthia]
MGCLIAAVARLNGAASVAISDMEEFPLSVALRLGADAAFKAADPALADLANGCEACFEASGSVGGMNTCLRSAAPGGTVVHVGFLGEGGCLSGQHDGHPQGSHGLRLVARLSGIPACCPPRGIGAA